MKIKFLNTDRPEENFDSKLITIGREDDNMLKLHSDGISRYHGKLYCNAKGEWFIEDLGSTNGILLNGQKVTVPTGISNGDIINFYQDKLQVYDFEEFTTANYTPLSTDTAKISISDIIETNTAGTVTLDPIIPENDNIISLEPADIEENEKEPELDKLAEFIQQNTGNLFQTSQKNRTGSANTQNTQNKSKFSNKLFYVTLICAVIVIAAFMIKILEDKKKTVPPPTVTVKDYPIYLTYIKENISPNNVFRFQLIIENDQASFSVDDLKSQLRYGPIVKTVSDTEIAKLKQTIKDSQFMQLKPVPEGIVSNNEREFKELNIVHGPTANHIILKNRPAPREFIDIEEAINIFAESCNMATFSLSPAELKEQALNHYRIAEDKFANYEINLANLKEAVNGYNIVIEYLSGITPEPKIRRDAATKMKRAKDIREKLIRQYRSQYVTMLNQSDLNGAKSSLETLLKLYEANSKEYIRTKERLIKVDAVIRKIQSKK